MVFRDLLERIGRISRLDPGERVAATRQGSLNRVVPITFRGLASGLMQIARRYAGLRSPGGTYAAGVRAVKATEAASGPVQSIRYLMRVADLCEESGHATLALTVLDDAEKARHGLGTSVDEALARRLAATLQRRYRTLLARLFEAMMKEGRAEELWRLASSRAAHALEHRAPVIMAQCLAWMAAAAVLKGRKVRSREGQRARRDRAGAFVSSTVLQGFANLYLGHAERRSGSLADAARAYSRALELFDPRKPRQIHATAMLSMAQVAEQLGDRMPPETLRVGRQMARAMTRARSRKRHRRASDGSGSRDIPRAAAAGSVSDRKETLFLLRHQLLDDLVDGEARRLLSRRELLEALEPLVDDGLRGVLVRDVLDEQSLYLMLSSAASNGSARRWERPDSNGTSGSRQTLSPTARGHFSLPREERQQVVAIDVDLERGVANLVSP